MRAVVVQPDGSLRIEDVPRPPMRPGGVRIAVAAAGINRADLLQRSGHYPPPPGASEILGMECSGRVIETGASVHNFKSGDRVMALIPGGGYADEVVSHAGSVMKVPAVVSDEEAGGIPEVFLTAFLTIFRLGSARRGETLLVHGGGSGVGTAATTLAKLADLKVVVTAGSDDKCRLCLEHGADVAINYNSEDFVEKAGPVDIVLDHIGARYLARDLETLKTDGRVVVIGSMGGQRTAEIDVTSLLGKRLQIIGSTLRARSDDEKAELVRHFMNVFGADLERGRIRPVIHRVIPMERAAEAHELMRTSEHFGKIILSISPSPPQQRMPSP